MLLKRNNSKGKIFAFLIVVVIASNSEPLDMHSGLLLYNQENCGLLKIQEGLSGCFVTAGVPKWGRTTGEKLGNTNIDAIPLKTLNPEQTNEYIKNTTTLKPAATKHEEEELWKVENKMDNKDQGEDDPI